VPFPLAADLGNFAGGGLSSYLIRRGWPVLRARKVFSAAGRNRYDIASFPAICRIRISRSSSRSFALSTFSYAAWFHDGPEHFPQTCTPNRNGKPTVRAGMSGAAGPASETIISTLAIGKDHRTTAISFEPVLIRRGSLLPVICPTVLVFVLISTRGRMTKTVI